MKAAASVRPIGAYSGNDCMRRSHPPDHAEMPITTSTPAQTNKARSSRERRGKVGRVGIDLLNAVSKQETRNYQFWNGIWDIRSSRSKGNCPGNAYYHCSFKGDGVGVVGGWLRLRRRLPGPLANVQDGFSIVPESWSSKTWASGASMASITCWGSVLLSL